LPAPIERSGTHEVQTIMSDIDNKFEKAKGHAKEAVGDLTDDKKLEREGRRDRAAGEAKEKVERAKDKVEEGIDNVKDKLDSRDR
jgi:uncharacterized protein YjbJ (UPF0337 family)